MQNLQETQSNRFNGYLSKFSTTVISHTESLKKIESNLNFVTQTVSKHDHKLNKEQEIYIEQQKAINSCITKAEIHVQNSKAIISNFDEKLNKAILDTKQVATDISKACNKATSLKYQVSDFRFDDIEETLLNHDEELQNMMNKISMHSQQKGQFAATHLTVLNYNNTTELFPILKPTKH
eukprot:11685946-Ditylum_brightwellii.AAC.1